MQCHPDSHLDHALTDAQIAYIFQRFADAQAFFIATFELPEELGTLPCNLYGPLMGDAPVLEADVEYCVRPPRAYASRRLRQGGARPTRQVTVIAGPHDGQPCVLFTAYGGPCAPQEPGDPGCRDRTASTAFWAEHALAR